LRVENGASLRDRSRRSLHSRVERNAVFGADCDART
jgi:hypothetical protein